MLNCSQCQTILSLPFANNFCDRSCFTSYHNERKTKNKKYVLKCCAECGKETKNIKFCSTNCGWLSKVIYKTEEEKLHATRMRYREATARYAAKKKHQTPVGADLDAIKLFYANCPIGYEVDHIIPISKGGPHSIENLQYLTISENRKKSNKLVPLTGI